MRRIGLEKAAPMAPNMEIASTQKKGGGGEKKKGKRKEKITTLLGVAVSAAGKSCTHGA